MIMRNRVTSNSNLTKQQKRKEVETKTYLIKLSNYLSGNMKENDKMTNEELIETIEYVKMISQNTSSLDIALNEETPDGDTILDIIPSELPTPEEELEIQRNKEIIRKVVSTLPPRELIIVNMRYGLEDGKCRTLEEIGKHFGITRERIRQIEAKAIKRLRIRCKNKSYGILDDDEYDVDIYNKRR